MAVIGLASDHSGIQFRTAIKQEGGVQGPRAQIDRDLYKKDKKNH